MKKLILILLFPILSFSQSWSINVYQDLKLAILKDDYGNTPYTADIIGKNELRFKNNFFVYPQFEFADLNSGHYIRVSVGTGYSINTFKFLDIKPSVNYGYITRFGRNKKSLEFQIDNSIKINRKLRVLYLVTYTQRSDVNIWRLNSYLGLGFDI